MPQDLTFQLHDLGGARKTRPVPPLQQSQCLLVKLGLPESLSTVYRQNSRSRNPLVKLGVLGPKHNGTSSRKIWWWKLGILESRSTVPGPNPNSQGLLVELGLLGPEHSAESDHAVSSDEESPDEDELRTSAAVCWNTRSTGRGGPHLSDARSADKRAAGGVPRISPVARDWGELEVSGNVHRFRRFGYPLAFRTVAPQ